MLGVLQLLNRQRDGGPLALTLTLALALALAQTLTLALIPAPAPTPSLTLTPALSLKVGPVLLLGVLLVQTLTLDGAADGVSYYIGKFDWARLAESEVWAVAC